MFDFDLRMFGFEALISPYLICISIIIIGYYLYLTRNVEMLLKKIFFVIGIILFYLFLGSPIDLLAHLIFSIHMIQMAGLFFVSIPFIVYGCIDDRLLIKKNWNLNLKNLLMSLGIFNTLFSLYHLPIFFEFIMTNYIFHDVVHALLILTCMLMWYPLFNRGLSPIKKIGYIFVNGILLTPACALIIFSDIELYRIYTNPIQWFKMMQLCVSEDILASLQLSGPYFFKWITPLEDQQLGGVLMKIIQEIVLGGFIGYVFYTGFRKERIIDKIEEIQLLSK